MTLVAHELATEGLPWTGVATAMPRATSNERLTIELDNSRVIPRYHGPYNGRGSVSMRWLPANDLYMVDWVVVGRMPYKDRSGYDIHGMVRSTRDVLKGPPVELFIGGHADAGTREDVQRYLDYLQA